MERAYFFAIKLLDELKFVLWDIAKVSLNKNKLKRIKIQIKMLIKMPFLFVKNKKLYLFLI